MAHPSFDLDVLGRHVVRVLGSLPGMPTPVWESMTNSGRDEARTVAGMLAEAFLPELTPPRRTFFARVSLMGHRDLGLCRVEESSLGGQEVLRATTLTEETERVHWIRASSIWCATEVPEADALAQAEEAREERARQAAEKVRREQERAEEIAKARALRVGAFLLISTNDDGNLELRALRAGPDGAVGVPGALRAHQPDVQDALRAAKADFYAPSHLYDRGAVIGFCFHAGHRVVAIARAFETLGFDRIELTGPQVDFDGDEGAESEEVEF